ncbi:polyketide cyclase / dehydrase and lipid transport [Epidermidibacterium keratini]|uniref:Polyketide cyclase / dehydrase and lipid transport n=1 Tax=Epidermidibacterium keratini TaxID=1891644 RepID=A0A7L4YIM2_9ACTN|nr:polyketide cyclase / dehydrase and lipid transport [Epidermidibacterium keratini]QHB99185.1 polyketide cyclase / dehydrase and lipid transport [Epidermidibacterium keratini]
MHQIDIADDTFVRAPVDVVAAATADRARWRRWWPDLRLQVAQDRGLKGTRFEVSGPLTGTMEIWLEPVRHGVVLHYFLRADLSDQPAVRRTAQTERERERRRRSFRHHMWALKDELEAAPQAAQPTPVLS